MGYLQAGRIAAAPMSRADGRDEAGVAAVLVSMFFAAVFFGLAALTVDVSRWYLEGQRVQKAADAAALAGVTWMPQDLDQATLAARDVAARNGYPDSASNVVVAVKAGVKPSELNVTVSSTIGNVFAPAFGDDNTTITRHAIANYTGAAPMGSPCNTFGNEPAGTPAPDQFASQLSVPVGATCTRCPQFWMTRARSQRLQDPGRRVPRAYCESAESGCEAASPKKNKSTNWASPGRATF